MFHIVRLLKTDQEECTNNPTPKISNDEIQSMLSRQRFKTQYVEQTTKKAQERFRVIQQQWQQVMKEEGPTAALAIMDDTWWNHILAV